MKAWMRLKRIILLLIALFVMGGASWAAQKELPKKNTGTLPVVLEADEMAVDFFHAFGSEVAFGNHLHLNLR